MNSFYMENWGIKIILGGISLKNIFIGYKNEKLMHSCPFCVCTHCQGTGEMQEKASIKQTVLS